MTTLAERAARIGHTAKSFEDARGSTKAEPVASAEAQPSSDPPRDWWDVHKPDGSVVAVLVRPAQTHRAMSDLYPGAAVCQP